MKKIVRITALTAILALAAGSFGGCASEIKAEDLTENIAASSVEGRDADEKFIAAYSDFSAELFKKCVSEGENTLVSPLSAMLALAMTGNGAGSETKAEFESVLGGGMSVGELDEYLYSYVNSLPSDEKYKLSIANSLWIKNDDKLTVEEDFLRNAKDYYSSEVYSADFDEGTLKDINGWVKENTGGGIDKIISEISPAAVMYLINALYFDGEWQNIYKTDAVHDGEFHALSADGEVRGVEMMYSDEWRYLEDDNAVGFIKNYKDGKYGFMALLPNENISVYDYVLTLSGEKLTNIVKNAENEQVEAGIPKFKFEYGTELSDALSDMGLKTAFDPSNADFSALGHYEKDNIYIDQVIHKTFISVDEKGTKAGAATAVEMDNASAALTETRRVILDRPFVFGIIDMQTGLPIFLGTVSDIA